MPHADTTPAPLVSVVIPCAPGVDPSRALLSLQAQSMPRWQAILVGEPSLTHAPTGDSRVETLPSRADGFAALCNRGLEHVSGEFVTFLSPRDGWEPGALESLLAATNRNRTDAALCGYTFFSPLGPMPGNPLEGLARPVVGLDELRICKLAPLHAMIVRTASIGPLHFAAEPEQAGDYLWMLRLAERGVRWAVCPQRLARVTMGGRAPSQEILDSITAHARALDNAWETAPDPERKERRERFLQPYVEAIALLRAFMEDVEDAHRRPEGAGALASMVHPGNLFAQWWHRLRFCGLPPRHALDASGGADLSALATPVRTARWMLSSCDPGRKIVLLGLGRNGREVARLMHERGLAIIGRDDALRGPPAWAAHDGAHVTLLAPDAPWDPDAQYLMTPADDRAFLARLPEGIRPVRWSDARHGIARAFADQALSQTRTGAGRELPGKMLEAHHPTPLGASSWERLL